MSSLQPLVFRVCGRGRSQASSQTRAMRFSRAVLPLSSLRLPAVLCSTGVLAAVLYAACLASAAEPFDLVILNGRVLDPETGLDAVRHVGIRAGTIAALAAEPLHGEVSIDARGLIVAPGFIDLHWHGKEPHSSTYQAMDGVTATFELEIGVADVDRWYDERAGRMPIHYGVAVGHAPVRMSVLGDPGDFLPAGDAARRVATDTELTSIRQQVERGLERGAVGVGFGLAYTPAASRWEILQMFRVAAAYRAPAFVHIRGASSAGSADREEGLLEVIAMSAVSGAPVHVAHINSSGQGNTARMLDIIADARAHGVDVTTECYPYTAGATRIESFLFDAWLDKPAEEYGKLQWAATGERLTKESFLRYRKQGGLVLIHANTEEVIRTAVTSPLTLFASDGFDVYPRNGHPRSAATYSKVLGRYVREQGALTLMEALRKMTLMPAHRLEARVPEMARKGRLAVGADADIAIFDPGRIVDRATYEEPAAYSEGMRYVLVSGALVVRDGRIVPGAAPGKPVRAARLPH
jgi:N-acyl-D-aspartate/D-glutamate deacylase